MVFHLLTSIDLPVTQLGIYLNRMTKLLILVHSNEKSNSENLKDDEISSLTSKSKQRAFHLCFIYTNSAKLVIVAFDWKTRLSR